jgi:molybdopterin-dependent oxidoreductase alpha subunit
MIDETRKVFVEPPQNLTGIEIKEPQTKAAGLKGVTSALYQMNKYMGLAKGIPLSLKMNQKSGFDCPGCAWPDPDDDRSRMGEFCENGIKAIAEEATKKSLKADFFAKHSIQELSQLSDFELGKSGRLTEPMILRKGKVNYEAISWDEAFRLIADELNGLATPDEAIFYTSGRTSNEAAYLYQLLVRAYGTNNLPDCSNMCHESSGVALSETVGIGKGSVTLEDVEHTDLLLILGQNPGTNHPRMLTSMGKCKKNGGKIIAVNPLPEAGFMKFADPQNPLKLLGGSTQLSDLYLPVKVNGDVAFLKAVMLLLLEEEEKNPGTIFDLPFIEKYTSGYDELITHLKKQNLDECIADSGLSKEQIIQAKNIVLSGKTMIICWAMGITQHENSVDNIREIVNLLLLRGSIGKPGAGTCPVRGHSNVQGDRTMGIWEMPKEPFLQKLDEYHGIHSPREHGFDVVSAIEAMKAGKAKVFFAMGGNFLSASPDTNYTAEALQNCDLTVHVSTKLNRSHLVCGKQALILPCLGRTDKDFQESGEQFVSCENSMGVIQQSRGRLNPPSKNLKSEVRIVAELGAALLPDSPINWMGYARNYDKIREAIQAVIPGFDDYNNRVRRPGGFYLPNGARVRKFNTKTGKANFTAVDLPKRKVEADELVMFTIRSHDQYNTTIYGLDDRYRGIHNERRVVMMNEADMKDRQLNEGDLVDLESTFKGVTRKVSKFIVVPYPVPKGNAATYFPEANPLVPINSFARISRTPSSKWVNIRVLLHKE